VQQTVAGGVCTVAQDARATNARTNKKRKRGANFGRPMEKEKGVDKGGKVVSRREETVIVGGRECSSRPIRAVGACWGLACWVAVGRREKQTMGQRSWGVEVNPREEGSEQS
jgi:hypothetical protein